MKDKELLVFSKWGNIYGILSIIFGVLVCLAIIGVFIGIPIIFAGINMIKGAKKAKSIATRTSNGEAIPMEEYDVIFKEIGQYTKIMSITSIAFYVFWIVVFILYCILVLIMYDFIYSSLTSFFSPYKQYLLLSFY